jgi:hypothetical protein
MRIRLLTMSAAVAVLAGSAMQILSVVGTRADSTYTQFATAVPGNGEVIVGVGENVSHSAPASVVPPPSGMICTYTPVDAQYAALLGPRGSSPGMWVMPTCVNGGFIDPLPPTWVITASPIPQASPLTAARQALAQLTLPQAAIRMAPDSGHEQLVGARTWLWVDPSSWHAFSATAALGSVAATATAQPTRVVWDMGDGESVACAGPGTPYDPARAEGAQSTDCSYVWPRSSAAQPSETFAVTATVYWEVAWTARGTVGGGNLGTVTSPPARVAVRVAEAQAVNQAG